MATELLLLLGRLLLVFLGGALLGLVMLGMVLLLLVVLPTPNNSVDQDLHEAVVQLNEALREAIVTSRLGRFLERLIGGGKRG